MSPHLGSGCSVHRPRSRLTGGCGASGRLATVAARLALLAPPALHGVPPPRSSSRPARATSVAEPGIEAGLHQCVPR